MTLDEKDFIYELHDQLGGDDRASTELFAELVSFLSVDLLSKFEEHFRTTHSFTVQELQDPDSETDIIDNVALRQNLAQCSEV